MISLNIKRLTRSYVLPMLFLGGFTTPIEASFIGMSNSTITTFYAASGERTFEEITFDWDKNSIYDITGTNVELYKNDIIIPGGKNAGSVYEFVIPNFYDPLPMKKIEITMQGGNRCTSDLALPSVLDIIGADSDYDDGGPALPVLGSFVSDTTSPTLVTEYWEMFPNPDFEIVKLYVPAEFELQSITIATVSAVPVPAAVWLFSSGLLGLAGVARRRA